MNRTTEAIRQASELHRRALGLGAKAREAEAIRVMRQALAMLDSVAAEASEQTDWLRAWFRIQVTMAYSQAELGTVAVGLTRLKALRAEIARLPHGSVRSELNGFVDHNHATVLMRAGRDEEGIPLLDSAIEHKERCLAEGTDDPARITESLLASVANRGLAYVITGRLGPATRDLNRAIAIAIEHNLPIRLAITMISLGDLKRRTGDIPGALRCYEEAERICQEQGPDMLSRLRLDRAQALLAAGLADHAGQDLDLVIPHAREQRVYQDLAEAELFRAAAALLEDELTLAKRMATAARRRLLKRGNESWATIAALISLRVDARRAVGSGRIPARLPTLATQLAQQLRALRLTDDAMLADTLAARLELLRGNPGRAEALLAQVPRPGQLTPIEQRMLLRLCQAELAVAQGNRRKAFAQARAGLNELSRARDRMGGLELVSGTAIHGQELGDLAVRLVLDGGDTAAEARRLFDWLERTRAQTYRYEASGSDDPRLSELIAETRHLGYTLRQARIEGRPTAKLQSRYAERRRAAMRLGWHAASRWGKPRPVAGVTQVLAQLGSGALVSFAVSGDSLLAVVLAHGRVRLVRLGSAAEASENAMRLHADLNAMAPDHLPEPLFDAITMSARKHAAALDAQLLRPLTGLDGDLVIVPTGALYAVPWGALDSLRSRPVTVAPSATAWLAASQGSFPDGHTALVRGPGLTAAIGEIDKLAAHYDKARLLAGPDATSERVLGTMDGASLVHIAAHGEHEADNALFSRLELVDGALFAHELARLRRPPRQVVLAACELALNRIRPGDEALGFAGSLLAGGVGTVVAAASRVGDLPAAGAMDDYHRALVAGAAPAMALAEAVSVDPLRRPFVCLGS
nr:CHAT domain-containing protein [Kibdelosporangium sp. MJ126-NF4]CEL23593.1 Tetratricopeptide TPR_4 [Kibdelosporangium sp. MJ126-NF4]CTQ93129.1 Tetratricopeptide TPR_4 [Kibdelosporangium sp. MJ126-NF4]